MIVVESVRPELMLHQQLQCFAIIVTAVVSEVAALFAELRPPTLNDKTSLTLGIITKSDLRNEYTNVVAVTAAVVVVAVIPEISLAPVPPVDTTTSPDVTASSAKVCPSTVVSVYVPLKISNAPTSLTLAGIGKFCAGTAV